MKAVFYTSAGPQRNNNQDGVFIDGLSYTSMDEPTMVSLQSTNLMFAVVDGMGGMGGGEEATAIILEGLNFFCSKDQPSSELLESGLLGIQKMLHARAALNPGMGAAISGIWLSEQENLVFNCGDCRVYQSRSGFLEKLTHDHSIVQELADTGALTDEEMRLHPRKNVLTSALCANDPDPQIFCEKLKINPGDVFLLCSDGLWECLGLEELEACMSREPEQAAKCLKEEIWKKNARDNVSFIIVWSDQEH